MSAFANTVTDVMERLPENPQETPGFLIPRVGHLFRSKTQAALRDAGVRIAAEEYAVLLALVSRDEAFRVVDLAEFLLRDPTTVSRQLNRLFDQGLVEQTSDASDGRVVLLRPTAQGRELIAWTMPLTDNVRSSALRGISEEDYETMVRSLQTMMTNLIDN